MQPAMPQLEFTRGDVRRHLSELGYGGVTDEQLDDFVRDLRRLIRQGENQGGANMAKKCSCMHGDNVGLTVFTLYSGPA